MADPATNDASQNERLDEVLAGYLESEQSGQMLDRQRLLAENPAWRTNCGRSSPTTIG